MSSSQFSSDIRKSGKAPEKSNFVQACNLLSQYIKERGNLRDLNLGITGKLEAMGRTEASRSTTTTIDLLRNMEKSSDQISSQKLKSVNVFPQYAGISSSNTIEDVTIKASSSKPATTERQTAQMTIFYAGQVLVFDDFPADKAREVLLLASQESSPKSSSNLFPTSSIGKIKYSGSSVASASNILPNPGSNPAQERLQPHNETTGSDLPIARRASLHRFFEKRKDRATARAPYQVRSGSTAAPKHENHLELKL